MVRMSGTEVPHGTWLPGSVYAGELFDVSPCDTSIVCPSQSCPSQLLCAGFTARQMAQACHVHPALPCQMLDPGQNTANETCAVSSRCNLNGACPSCCFANAVHTVSLVPLPQHRSLHQLLLDPSPAAARTFSSCC
jgi:hypothetical protein